MSDCNTYHEVIQNMEHEIHNSPYRHIHLHFEPSLGLYNFPLEHLTQSKRDSGSDKTYSVNIFEAYKNGVWNSKALPTAWKNAMYQLADPSNVYRISHDLAIDPDAIHELEVRIASYGAGDWMSRHTDGADKLFSAIYYFSQDWKPSWGGDIRLYKSQDIIQASCQVFPNIGTGVAFARSDASWHEVMPVTQCADRTRDTILIHAYKK